MAIQLNDNIRSNVNRPTDWRNGPFVSTAEAISLIPLSQRYHGLPFGVYTNPNNLAISDVDCYYFYNDLTVFKPCNSGGGGGGTDIEWLETSVNLTMEGNKGYITTNNSTQVVLTLPLLNQRHTIKVAGKGTSGYKILIPVAITVFFSGEIIVTELISVENTGSLEFVCISENYYIVTASTGNFTYPD